MTVTPIALLNATGFFALAGQVVGLTSKSDRVLRACAIAVACLWALNNVALGASGAAVLWGITAVRQLSAAMLQGRPAQTKNLVFSIFAATSMVTAYLTWDGPTSLFSASSTILAAYAMFYMRGSGLRLIMVTCAALWTVSAWHYAAGWQIAGNAMVMVAGIYGAWKTRPALPLVQVPT